MAFTADEQQKIRGFLGYSSIYTDSLSHVQNALDLVGAQTEDANQVRIILTAIASIDAKLSGVALATSGMSSAGVGDPEFYQGQTIRDLTKLGRIQCGRLASKLNLRIVADHFSGGGAHTPAPTFFG